ncbi:carbohydrate ABC transporter permease [Paenibacillus physcomitrellae]|uniref:Sugar ABC transporter permease n=1 Tax=Paenibacillus physcomitrellae TaxID=1619311 RepID=A0ABQ1GSS3_9BACL|nr:carbohydrate ABC transporter permease [Paenibacillus physcomitrellae]GGA48952.1 sugar ABC transporter permease [Paenibacillus physcomitrellae]
MNHIMASGQAGSRNVRPKIPVGKVIVIVLLILFALCTLFPLLFLLINSFKDQGTIVASPMSLPSSWSFTYISSALEQIHFGRAVWITAVVTVIAVALIVFCSSMLSWVLVRSRTRSSSLILLLLTAAMLVPFQSLMYPLIHEFEGMGLKDLTGLVLMYGGFGLGMSVFLYHGFIKGVPMALEEAALIDGANIFRLFFGIVFPLVKPITVTVIILNSLWIWNDYLLPFLVLGNAEVKTLTLELYYAKMLSGQFSNPWELIFPAVLVSIIPVVVLYLFLQKYFIKGVTEGAVK